MPSKKRTAPVVKRVTRSHSKETNPAPPPPQPSLSSPILEALNIAHPPRRNAPPARAKGQRFAAMGSLPPGPSSSVVTPASTGGQSPNSGTMVFLRDMLRSKSKLLIAHLANPKRDDEMWSQYAKVLNDEVEMTKERYLEQDAIFIDPAVGEKITRERTAAEAELVVEAAYTANLATLLYLCNQFKSSTGSDMVTGLLEPLDDSFPDGFIPIPIGKMDRDRAGELSNLAILIRYYLALVLVGEGIKQGQDGRQLRMHITEVFAGVKEDDDVDAFIDNGSLKSFAGVDPDRNEINEQVSKLVEMVDSPDRRDMVKQELSELKLPLLESLEAWAKHALLLADANQLAKKQEREQERRQAQERQPQHELHREQVRLQTQQQNGRAVTVVEVIATDDPEDTDEDDSSSDSDTELPPAIAAAAMRDGPPGGSPSQYSQRGETPQDHPDINLSQFRSSGGQAHAATRPSHLARLSKIQEESEGLMSAIEDSVRRPSSTLPSGQQGRRGKRLATSIEEDDEEDEPAFQTDPRGSSPKRPRLAMPSTPSAVPRRPLPAQARATTATASPQGSRRRRSLPQSGPKVASRSRPAAPMTAGDDDGDDVGGVANEDDGLDFSIIRNDNSEERRRMKSKKGSGIVQHRIPWNNHDERELIKAIALHSAKWSVIARTADLEVERDQQQVRDKARNLKVDFLAADAALPPGFDLVALGAKEKKKVVSMGKNPLRRVEDFDEETGTVTNNLWLKSLSLFFPSQLVTATPPSWDPLSIAAGAAGLATACAKIAGVLYTWIDDTVEVDSTVAGLYEEISALSRALNSIGNAVSLMPRPAIAVIDPDGSLWSTVGTTLANIRGTLEKLDQILVDVQKSNFFGRGLLRRPTKQIKLSLKLKDITVARERAKSYNTVITSTLLMVNVCLLMQSNSSQDSVLKVLSGLKSHLMRVELSTNQRSEDGPGSTGSWEEDGRISRNMQQFVRVAEAFHSNASSIAREGPRSTVWGGSIAGDPLSEQQISHIENWIPPPVVEEEEEAESSTARASPLNPDSDDDLDKEIAERLEKLALDSLKNTNYAEAESFYRGAIDRGESVRRDPQDITSMKLNLAHVCLCQSKWDEAKNILVPVAVERKATDVRAFHLLHAIAIAHFDGTASDPSSVSDATTSDLNAAYTFCRKALAGKKKTIGIGTSQPSYWETLSLLAAICDKKNDRAEAEAHRSFFPDWYLPRPPESPLEYLERTMSPESASSPPIKMSESVALRSTVKNSRPDSFISEHQKQPQQSDSTPHLVVSVHFGTSHTATGFVFTSDSTSKKEMIMWQGRGVPMTSEHGKIVGWGLEIHQAIDLNSGSPRPGVQKIEWLHMQLVEGASHYEADDAAPLPPGKTGKVVTAAFLSKVRKATQAALLKRLGTVYSELEPKISWVFAIPTPGAARRQTALTTAIILAGFLGRNNDNRLTFVPEAEAVIVHSSKTGLFKPHPGGAYIVVHAGAITVEITVFTAGLVNPLQFLHYSTQDGGCNGFLIVNRNFSLRLRARLAKTRVPSGSRIYARLLGKCILTFERHIKQNFRNDGRNWAVDVGLDQEIPEIGLHEGRMTFTNEEVLQCFHPVVDPIVRLLQNEIRSVQAGKSVLKGIICAGEFGSSEYLFQTIESSVGLQPGGPPVMRTPEFSAAPVMGAITCYLNTPRTTHSLRSLTSSKEGIGAMASG